MVTFPLSVYLYLDNSHPWWRVSDRSLPSWLNLLPHWNRSLFFTLLTIPFKELLRRELARQKIDINLGRRH